jgi:hypothetical protein
MANRTVAKAPLKQTPHIHHTVGLLIGWRNHASQMHRTLQATAMSTCVPAKRLLHNVFGLWTTGLGLGLIFFAIDVDVRYFLCNTTSYDASKNEPLIVRTTKPHIERTQCIRTNLGALLLYNRNLVTVLKHGAVAFANLFVVQERSIGTVLQSPNPHISTDLAKSSVGPNNNLNNNKART